MTMPLREGDVFQCHEADCGCEVTVTKAGTPINIDQEAPISCCGQVMVKKPSEPSSN
jgi:hypothetical protein